MNCIYFILNIKENLTGLLNNVSLVIHSSTAGEKEKKLEEVKK